MNAVIKSASGGTHPRVSIFRVKAHMELLERAMDEHLRWYGEEAVAAAARAAGAAPPPKVVAKAEQGKPGGAGAAKTSGFGMAKGGKGAKKPKAKKKR